MNFRKSILYCCTFGIIALHSFSAHAAESPEQLTFELSPIVVTATTTPVKAQNVFASVAVITREDIERNHYTNLYEALQHVEGLHTVMYADGVGFEVSGESNPTIRGTSNVLVLVDGVNQNLGTRFRSNIAKYSMDDIERIEVLRGSASTLYGANAVGGVINIIRKRNVDGITTKVGYALGSGDYDNFKFSTVGSENDFFWAVSLNKTLTDTLKDGHGNRRNSHLNANYGDFKLGYNISDTVAAIFTYNRHQQDMEWVRPYSNWDATGNGILSTNRLTFTLDYNAKDGKERNQLSVYRGMFKNRRYYYNTDGKGKNDSEISDDRFFTIVNRYFKQLNDSHRIAAGLEYQKTGTGSVSSKLSEKSFYLQDEWDINQSLKLTTGARYVKPDAYDDDILLSANLGYKINNNVSIYTSSNEFYVTPTATQVFGNIYNGGGYYANPNLKATNGRTNEIGANIKFDNKTYMDFNFYRRTQKDAIAAGKLSNGNTAYVNLPGKTATKGLEVSFTKYFGKYFQGRFGYAHLGADSPSVITRFARDQFSARLSYVRKDYNINIEGLARYDIVPTSPFITNKVKYLPETTYWVWNVSMNYHVNKHLNAFLKVNNIMDLYYMNVTSYDTANQEMAYFTSPGRTFVVGLEYTF